MDGVRPLGLDIDVRTTNTKVALAGPIDRTARLGALGGSA